MFQTNLILTRTHVDLAWLSKILSLQFCTQNQIANWEDLQTKYGQDLSSLNSELLDSNWLKGLQQGLIWQPKIDSKEDYRGILLSFYAVYTKPTVMFLGNLDDYSLALQEGMLRLLEEPPANLYLILFSQTKSTVLPTIYSRCKVSVVPSQLVLSHLDPSKLANLKAKQCDPKKSVKNLLAGKKLWDVQDLGQLERDEIDFWLWQILAYLEIMYTKDPKPQIAALIQQVSLSRKFNLDNVQKKLALSY
jgi:hypothetical protein